MTITLLSPPQTKRATKDETRARILATARSLFRQYGHLKTTVADIAGELDMSPANVYKFFPSKNAIIEAAAEINIAELRDQLRAVIRREGTATEKIENFVLCKIRHHVECLKNERQIHKLIMMVDEQNWACVAALKIELKQMFADIVAEGMRTGEFRSGNPAEIAVILYDCLAGVLHPLLTLDTEQAALEVRARTQVRFLARALW